MRKARRRLLAAALLVLVAAPAALLALLLFAPQALLTAGTVGWAIRRAGRAYSPRWESFDFEIRSPEAFEYRLSVSASGLRFAKDDGSVSGRFKTLAASLGVALSPAGARVTNASLDAQGDTLRLAAVTAAAPGPPAAGGGLDFLRLPRLIPAALSGIKFGPLTVDLPKIEVVRPGAATNVALRLAFDPARRRPLILDARWTGRGAGGVQRGRLRAKAESDFFRTGRLTRAAVSGSLDADGAAATFSAKARQAGAAAVAVDLRASGTRGAMSFDVRGRGLQTRARYALKGSFGVSESTGPLLGLRLEPFGFTAERKGGAALPSSLRLEAALRARPAAFRPVRGFTPPAYFGGRLVLNARATPTRSQADHFDADLSILLNPYTSWYEAHADLFATASGRTGDLASARIVPRLDASVTVARFEDLVAFLAGGLYAVPAPLDSLEGGVRVSLTARGEPGKNRIDFGLSGRADLARGKQRLKLHVSGKGAALRPFSPDRFITARATATLDDVAVQLPHLDPLKMPKVTLDPRIKTGPSPANGAGTAASAAPAAVSSSPASVALDLDVVTAKPVLLYSDLAKTPVPIALDLKLEKPPGAATGIVKVETFDVEFFRREATVDHVTLTLRPGSKVAGLDGLIKYKAAEVLIRIRLLGTTDKPQVVFESDPPLSQNDIVSLLVFGKSPDELSADQSATVSNTQTAMSDKAFGLASLYLFASTPIQFVGYDPASKAYTMRLRIPGGETLTFSSDFDATRTVQLRKRLSRHFAVAAEAVNSQTQGNGVVTFLEWFTRY